MNGKDIVSSAVHPGEILAEELRSLGVSPTELSRQIKVPPNRVTQIVKGQRNISGDTALRFGHWFGTSAQFWLNLQSAYDLNRAEKSAGIEIAKLPTRPSSAAVVGSIQSKHDHLKLKLTAREERR
ncbi:MULTISPECIES: HigA family addiction module antitoxin [Agrobacterium]|uniref:HigA family addiction module antitoxin n=1 Tax=Agrobacterium tumefaciens TaxID=358 RepID=UPI001B8A353F